MGACFSRRVAFTSHAQGGQIAQPKDHEPSSHSDSVLYPASRGVDSEQLRQKPCAQKENPQRNGAAQGLAADNHKEATVQKREQKLWSWANKALPMANACAADVAGAAPTDAGREETNKRESEPDSDGFGERAFERAEESRRNKGSSVKQEARPAENSSPHRRRRLSVSQSAQAKEDDGKERGQTIIAVDSDDAGHILGQPAENGSHVDEGGSTVKNTPALECGEQRNPGQEGAYKEHGNSETADDEQDTGRDEGEQATTTHEKNRTLENIQRRRLSLSQSAEVASPSQSEIRGHTSVQLGNKEEESDTVNEVSEPMNYPASSNQAHARVKNHGRAQSSGRRLSVVGLSSEGHLQTNFEDKKVEKHGQAAQESLAHFGIGMCCKKGFKPESPNQDDFFVIKVDKWSLYGVFDGHGPAGHDVSNYVQRELPARLLYGDIPFLHTPLRALQKSFKQVHNELEQQTELNSPGCMDCSMSGTTATVVLHIHPEKKLYVAHVGDSRAVLAQWVTTAAETSKGKKSPRLVALDLTADHKPTNDIERQRIIRTGGQIRRLEGDVPHRVFLKNRLFPGLAMSRAIGDTLATQAGVIPDPDVKEFQLVEGRDEFLLICSDGVWEFISSQEAVEIVEPFGRRGVQKACEVLARESWRRWIEEEHTVVDDITALIIYLR